MAINSITLDEHLAQAGPAAESFARLWRSIWRQTRVSADQLELCRVLFARLHQDREEFAAVNANIDAGAVLPARRAAVAEGAASSDVLSPADKAILEFAEYYWLDPQSITDDAADAVKAHVGEPGLVLLIEALGCIDGRIRAARCLRDLKAFARESAHVR